MKRKLNSRNPCIQEVTAIHRFFSAHSLNRDEFMQDENRCITHTGYIAIAVIATSMYV